MPREIKIFCNGDYTVIIDGRISEHLCWDEMLGHIASATLTGKPRYMGYVLGEDPDWWKRPKGLLNP